MARLSQEIRQEWLRIAAMPLVIAFGVIVVAGIFLESQNQSIVKERMRNEVLAQVSVIRAKLEGNINSNIQLVRGLVATIATEPDMQQERFDALAGNLLAERSQLRSIAAAPGLVVRMTYPLEGNERAIGLDYRDYPAQWTVLQSVMETGQLALAGPVDLVQGGQGFIGRFPVYTGEDRSFWGVISAVVDVDRLYYDSGLFDADLGLDVSITGRDGTGGAGRRFYGPNLTTLNPVLADVVLPGGTWQIAAVPSAGWTNMSGSIWLLRGAILVAGALILLPIAGAGLMLGERQVHVRELRAREEELARVTQRLNLALETSKVGVWELDLDTGEEIWDERTNELYGLPNDGAPRLHDHWWAAVHPDDRARAERDFNNMIQSGRYESYYRVVQPDGSVRHVRSIGAMRNEPGEGIKVVGANWDVTSDVVLNEDLRRAKLLTEARNQELEAARISIEYNALHDSLTGLPNRRYLDETLRQHAAAGYRGSKSIALLHIDLDRFKQINDTLGHAAGDAMLVHASQILRQKCQPTDFVARIGGDEFVILSTATGRNEDLASLAEQIVQEMRKPAVHEGHECRFGVSVGIAVAHGPLVDVKQLLINADIALYRAKARGRNRFEFFSEALQAEVVNTKRVADDILKGLDRNAFEVHYQPQFSAEAHDLVGIEALVRWRHPTEGLKAPASFMDVAEELNVVGIIDRIVLERTLEDLARWDAMGICVPRASVNVSLRRLNDEGLIDSLRQLAIEPGRISFELVESIYLDENDNVVGWNIDQIKELGIDIEIDDFGTGYASIVSLQKLHPARLKIDRQLVDPILSEPAQRRLVASIVDIGKSMGIEIVAEGVETMEHAAILKDLGCDILQGYAFARPMDRDTIERFITSKSWRRAV